MPRKFEPKTPVKVLQRGKQPMTAIPSQAPKRPRDDRYAQGQYYPWSNGYVEPELGIDMEIKIGDKEMVMVRNMELEIREDKEGPIDHLVHKAKPIIQPMELEKLVSIHHSGVLVVAREAMMEMGVIGAMVIGKGIKVSRMILKTWMRRRVIQMILLN